MTLERIRNLLLGHEIEPDAHARDLRLFFAMSWGLASSPAICPLLPDQLDGQLSQVSACAAPSLSRCRSVSASCLSDDRCA